jgi:hypothetical protein
MLQRATFEPVEAGALALCYDCPPHERGMSTFRRLGMAPSATMTRHARLLRTDRQLEKRLGWAAAPLARMGNALLRFSEWRGRSTACLEIALHEGRFGDEFSSLDRGLNVAGAIRSRRAAEDLNWRYRNEPVGDYRVLAARRHGELVGFVVLAVSGRDAVVVDIHGALSPDGVADLLDSSARLLRDAGVESLQAVVSSDSPLAVPLSRCGFWHRSTGPLVVVHARAGGPARAVLERKAAWHLTYSDVMA